MAKGESAQPTDDFAVRDSQRPTEELAVGDVARDDHGGNRGSETATRDEPPKGRFWRELSGALAAGLVLLAVAVLVLQIISWANGVPGLGVVELIGHAVAAGLAVYAQRVIDRRPGRPALVAGVGLGVVVVLVLVLFWWI
ncbi:hypothetical protein [Kibdelosporangium phytohabitans]|nr:hypothetical protein [Kibdelosporangium phytohabitans]